MHGDQSRQFLCGRDKSKGFSPLYQLSRHPYGAGPHCGRIGDPVCPRCSQAVPFQCRQGRCRNGAGSCGGH